MNHKGLVAGNIAGVYDRNHPFAPLQSDLGDTMGSSLSQLDGNVGVGPDSISTSSGSSGNVVGAGARWEGTGAAEQLAAAVMRSLAFMHTFSAVVCTTGAGQQHQEGWQQRQQQQQPVLALKPAVAAVSANATASA